MNLARHFGLLKGGRLSVRLVHPTFFTIAGKTKRGGRGLMKATNIKPQGFELRFARVKRGRLVDNR